MAVPFTHLNKFAITTYDITRLTRHITPPHQKQRADYMTSSVPHDEEITKTLRLRWFDS